MTTLKNQVHQDVQTAMRLAKTRERDVLRMLENALVQRSIALRERGRELSAKEEQEILLASIKQHRDSIRQFRDGGREDLVAHEEEELAILERYAPAAVDSETLERVVEEVIAEVGAKDMRDMGRVMGAAMPRIQAQGAVDGTLVRQAVEKKLKAL